MKSHHCIFKLQWLVKSQIGSNEERKPQRWLLPYLLAETVGVSAAVIAITVASELTSHELLLVAMSVYSATAGYYAVLFFHTWIVEQRTHTLRNSLVSTLRTLLMEYGSAELMDSLLFSPLLLYASLQLLPNKQLAVVASELASTLAFYATVFVIHAARLAWVQNGGLVNWFMTILSWKPCRHLQHTVC